MINATANIIPVRTNARTAGRAKPFINVEVYIQVKAGHGEHPGQTKAAAKYVGDGKAHALRLREANRGEEAEPISRTNSC